MRIRTLTTLLAAAAILCFMTPMTQAQTATTGQIVGVVTDPSGALVTGAKVVLTSDAGVRREAQTGGNGRYTFPLLDPGAYRLEVTQSGFASAKLEGISVRSPKARSSTLSSRWRARRPRFRSRANRRWCRRKAPPAAPSSTRAR